MSIPVSDISVHNPNVYTLLGSFGPICTDPNDNNCASSHGLKKTLMAGHTTDSNSLLSASVYEVIDENAFICEIKLPKPENNDLSDNIVQSLGSLLFNSIACSIEEDFNGKSSKGNKDIGRMDLFGEASLLFDQSFRILLKVPSANIDKNSNNLKVKMDLFNVIDQQNHLSEDLYTSAVINFIRPSVLSSESQKLMSFDFSDPTMKFINDAKHGVVQTKSTLSKAESNSYDPYSLSFNDDDDATVRTKIMGSSIILLCLFSTVLVLFKLTL